jgi:hypothetical protein
MAESKRKYFRAQKRCGVRVAPLRGKLVTPEHERMERWQFVSATLPALEAKLAAIKNLKPEN